MIGRAACAAVAVTVAVLALGCGAVVNEDAERARIETDRAQLDQRIVDLEDAIARAADAPIPALEERFVIRQFVRVPAAAAGSPAAELCLDLFGRGDVIAGIPPALTTSCAPVTVPPAGDPAAAIESFVGGATLACWSDAVPGLRLPACWPAP